METGLQKARQSQEIRPSSLMSIIDYYSFLVVSI